MTNKPVLHRRDHEHGGADPVRIVWESTGSGGAVGTPSFAGYGGTSTFGSTPAFVTLDAYSETSGGTVFAEATGYATILGPGFYQIAAWADIRFSTIPPADERAWFRPVIQDAGGGTVGWSIEEQNPELTTTRLTFPATVNEYQYAQRITVISLTDAADFPVVIKPEIQFTDPAHFVIWQLAVWGFRIGSEHLASLSD